MADIVLEGAAPFDGTYPMIPYNRYEQGQIRRLSGFMVLQYDEAFEGGDGEFIAAIAVLSMVRAGRITKQDVPDTFERILDMDEARILLKPNAADLVEDDADGPPPRSSSLSADTSGPGSSKSSETSEKTQNHNGTHDSDTSESAPVMLET